jgi:hypothetical protein
LSLGAARNTLNALVSADLGADFAAASRLGDSALPGVDSAAISRFGDSSPSDSDLAAVSRLGDSALPCADSAGLSILGDSALSVADSAAISRFGGATDVFANLTVRRSKQRCLQRRCADDMGFPQVSQITRVLLEFGQPGIAATAICLSAGIRSRSSPEFRRGCHASVEQRVPGERGPKDLGVQGYATVERRAGEATTARVDARGRPGRPAEARLADGGLPGAISAGR